MIGVATDTGTTAGACAAAPSRIEREQFRAFAQRYCRHNGLFLAAGLFVCMSLCGALLHLVFPAIGWAPALLAANVFGVVLALGMVFALFYYRLLQRFWRRLAASLFATALTGMLTGTAVRMLSSGTPLAGLADELLNELPRALAAALGVLVVVALPMLVVGALRAGQYEAMAARYRAEADGAATARELAESQLRLLRAQIEPHFLFNTLGAVQQLAAHGAPRAAALTADLIDFLRASMDEIRNDRATLAEEFGLVGSYLKVMETRLGPRLRFTLHLPPDLAGVRIPGMLVLTLVENAVKHGIEPALRGGEIGVEASRDDGVLRIRVRDSGAGMPAAADAGGTGLRGCGLGGSGLDNIRSRLRLAYGDAAGLSLEGVHPGTVAELTLPADA
jgi:signal transduction histidine kinase